MPQRNPVLYPVSPKFGLSCKCCTIGSLCFTNLAALLLFVYFTIVCGCFQIHHSVLFSYDYLRKSFPILLFCLHDDWDNFRPHINTSRWGVSKKAWEQSDMVQNIICCVLALFFNFHSNIFSYTHIPPTHATKTMIGWFKKYIKTMIGLYIC